MNKRQLEAAERAKLKYILDNNPKLKETVDNMIKNPNPELKDAVEPVIKEVIDKAERRGILIGWYTFGARAYENIKDMNSVEEIKEYFKQEQDKTIENLKLEQFKKDESNNNQGE